jgi:hypothetical protein
MSTLTLKPLKDPNMDMSVRELNAGCRAGKCAYMISIFENVRIIRGRIRKGVFEVQYLNNGRWVRPHGRPIVFL